jgi:hypothetical protein
VARASHLNRPIDRQEALRSAPERPQDPGEHGYGGTKQDYPAGDEPDTTVEPSEDADDGEDPREAPDPDQN